MAWNDSGLGTLAGITGVIAGLTGPETDADQITAAKTMLLAAVDGISTTLYNGAKLTVTGDVQDTYQNFQFSLVPLDLDV